MMTEADFLEVATAHQKRISALEQKLIVVEGFAAVGLVLAVMAIIFRYL